jgi:hypothetical protein
MAAIAAWFQGLFEATGHPPPVLVGGSAVELHTAGAYTSGDLDLVGELPPGGAQQLKEVGFAKRGRHWVNEEAELFIELPSSSLEPWETTAKVAVGEHEVLVLGLEEVLADCLVAWSSGTRRSTASMPTGSGARDRGTWTSARRGRSRRSATSSTLSSGSSDSRPNWAAGTLKSRS